VEELFLTSVLRLISYVLYVFHLYHKHICAMLNGMVCSY